MLGSNVSTSGGLSLGFKQANEWGCECMQIYITSPRTWNIQSLTETGISEFKSAWSSSKVKIIVAHVPYLVNLASFDSNLRRKSISRLIDEVCRAYSLGVPCLVLHPGSNPDRKKGAEMIVDGINHVFNSVGNSRVKVLLETVAGQGNMIGSKFEELAYILETIQEPENLGICFDTCHVFAAGYNIAGYDGYKSILEKFDNIIGLSKVYVIHINDSIAELGSQVDRHAAIGKGFLGLQFFHAIVRDPIFTDIPMILESPDKNDKIKDDLVLLKNLTEEKRPINEKHELPIQLTFDYT